MEKYSKVASWGVDQGNLHPIAESISLTVGNETIKLQVGVGDDHISTVRVLPTVAKGSGVAGEEPIELKGSGITYNDKGFLDIPEDKYDIRAAVGKGRATENVLFPSMGSGHQEHIDIYEKDTGKLLFSIDTDSQIRGQRTCLIRDHREN